MADRIGLYSPSYGLFFLRDELSAGFADNLFQYGPAGSNWTQLIGDWNGDGVDTVALYDTQTSTFYLKNSNSSGYADEAFIYGAAGLGWQPLVGDWNGDGVDTIGFYDAANGRFYLKDSNSAGAADHDFFYGAPGAGWQPVVGDWDGDGIDTIGMYDAASGIFYLRNENTSGDAQSILEYGPAGNAGWQPVIGDWDDNGADSVGLFNSATATFYLKNTNLPGPADSTFQFGPAGQGLEAIAGDWGVSSSDDAGERVFTLKQATTSTTETHTELMWDGVSYDNMLDFVLALTDLEPGFDLEVDHIVDINHMIYDPETQTTTFEFETEANLTIEGTAEMTQAYYDFVNSLLFDANGNSRLSERTVTSITTSNADLVLTPSQNNGSTVESGFTGATNDTIYAGQPELLHRAYIDAGAGRDILEIDMKGVFAQPLQLLGVEEIRVQNLPNVYGEDGELIGATQSPGEYPTDSALDLSRATHLEKLVVTEGFGIGNVDLGTLTIVGIRNNATARLEGGFTENVTLHYGQGLGSAINLELNLGDIDPEFALNIAQNSNVLNLLSDGGANWLPEADFGGDLTTLNISGPAEFHVDASIAGSFHANRTALINASANTGGINLTFDGDDTDAPSEVSFRGSAANDHFTAANLESVSIEDTAGNNTLVASAEDISIVTGAGNDHITLAGEATVATAEGNITDGALVIVDAGAGANTLVLGHDDTGLTALAGSSISGENITLIVDETSDLSAATLSGVTAVELTHGETLTLTAAQVADLGSAAFSVQNANFGSSAVLNILVTEDTTLADLAPEGLGKNVKLSFEIANDATLTLTAEELHKYVAVDGIDVTASAVPNGGKVVVTDAGLTFDAFANDLGGGSLKGEPDNQTGSDDLTIIRSVDGYQRPNADDSADTLTIDADSMPLVDFAIDTDAGMLNIIGNQDIVFEEPVNLGDDFTVDFSGLVGTVSGLTLEDFEDAKEIIGNGAADTRIDVVMGETDAEGKPDSQYPILELLKTSGVAQYVVTGIEDADNGAVIRLCDQSKDVEVLGLQGNAGKTMAFTNIPWGLVHPTFVMEGDGAATYEETLKAWGDPNASNIGTLAMQFFEPGADAVVNINNQGVALSDTGTSDGTPRPLAVDGIVTENASSLTIEVEDGNAVIASIDGDENLSELTLTSANDVTLHVDAAEGDLDAIDASGVAGTMTLVIGEGEDVDFTETDLSGIDAIVMQDGAELTLTGDQLTEIGTANLSVESEGDTATLNISGLAEEPFSVPALGDGIEVGDVIIADQPEVILNAATDLTGIATLQVHEGTVLNLTAEQFAQLDGVGAIVGVDGITNFTVNISGLTQALVDDGLTFSGITAGAGTLTLAEDVILPETFDLSNFAIELDTDQTITLSDDEQAHEREIGVADGATNTTVKFAFPYSLVDTTVDFGDGQGDLDAIDTSNYSGITMLQVLTNLVEGQNVEQVLAYLDDSIVVDIVDDMDGALVDPTNRVVVVEPDAVVDGGLIFENLEASREVATLDMTLLGNVQIIGDIDISNVTVDGEGFQTLTLSSEGDEPNVIEGDLKASDNRLLDVVIEAEQDLSIDGILFSGLVNGSDATLTVSGTGDVVIGDLHTGDGVSGGDENGLVETLTVDHTGTGALTIGLSSAATVDATDEITINGSADGLDTLVITGTLDLSDDTLVEVDAILLKSGAELTLNQAQLDAIGWANITVEEVAGAPGAADLNIVNVGADPFDATQASVGVDVVDVTTVAATVVMDATSDFTGVDQFIIPAGANVTISGDQFKQLVDSGATIVTQSTNPDDEGSLTVDLNGDLTIGTDDETTIAGANVTFLMADGETLNVEDFSLADGLQVQGDETAATKPLVNFTFENSYGEGVGSAATDTINVGGYQEVDVRILDALLDNFEKPAGTNSQSIEDLLVDLANANILNIYQQETVDPTLDPRDRVVVVEPNAVPDGIEFSAEGSLADYVRSIELTLQANADDAATINGDIYVNDGDNIAGYTLLTINAEDLGGATNPVTIDGDILSASVAAGDEGELTEVTINAEADIVIDGTIYFSSAGADDVEATLTLEGAGDITVNALDFSDAEVVTLNIVNNATGVVNVPGASPALVGSGDVVITGTGTEMNFGMADDATTPAVDESNTGVNAANVTSIDASGYSGDLNLGLITGAVNEELTILGSTGVTTLTLGAANDNNSADTVAEAVFIMEATDDVLIDLSGSAAGSTVTLSEAVVLPDMTGEAAATAGSLTIRAETLVIDGHIDFRDLVDAAGNSKLDLSAVETIELPAGSSVRMTAEQYDAFVAAGGSFDGAGRDLYIDVTNADVFSGIGALDISDIRGVTSIQIEETNAAGNPTGLNVLTLTSSVAALTTTVDASTTPVTESDAGDFSAFTTVHLDVDGAADVSDYIGLDTIDVVPGTNAALTVRNTQLSELDAGDASLDADFEETSGLTVVAQVVTGFDFDTGDAIIGDSNITATIVTRDVDNSITDYTVSGRANAIQNSLDTTITEFEAVTAADVTDFTALLAGASAVTHTFVGTEATIRDGDGLGIRDLEGFVGTADTFEFVSTTASIARSLDVNSDEYVSIVSFTQAEDDIDLTALNISVGNPVNNGGAVNIVLDATEALYVIDGDGTALSGGAGAPIADFTNMANVAAFLDDGFTAQNVADEIDYFVINDASVAGDAWIYEFKDAGGNAAIDAAELTLIGYVHSTAALTVTNFTL